MGQGGPGLELELRPVGPEEVAEFLRAEHLPFGLVLDEAELGAQAGLLELDRSLAAFCRGQIVGTAGAHTLELSVPGGVLPAAGVAYVGVSPTHRRRGVLRALMGRQLEDLRRRGEALAVLTASEGGIYGRFGYGVATFFGHFLLDRARAVPSGRRPDGGRVEMVDPEQAQGALAEVFDEVRARRPGEVSRSPAWWASYLAEGRGRGRPSFCALRLGPDGRVDGYALYRVERSEDPERAGDPLAASPTTVVSELVACGPPALAALFDFVLGVDLSQRVRLLNRPLDDPLRWLLTDPRQYRLEWASDRLWVRLVDLPAALVGRAWAGAGSLTLEVEDAACPWNRGTWAVEASPEGAEVAQTSRAPELSLGAAELGSAYLGGVRLSALAAAGRLVEHRPGAAARADRLLGLGPEPFCSTHF
ncbi:MAG TPA: GNAT family N-acetyltransferase [Acidimicrobiales bacterium]|nr:GNAT family N-acetyltransferase [Acidimicrobiales bacterium]